MWETLEIIHLPAQVSSVHSLAWSADFRLALATRRGVYVLTPNPDPACCNTKLCLHRALIQNDTEVNSYQLAAAPTQESVANLSKELRNQILMDRTLNPHMPTGETAFRQMREVGWSPLIVKRKECCLLTLSVDHRLRLLRRERVGWMCWRDLTSLLDQYINSHPELLTVAGDQYAQLIRRPYLLAVNSTGWLRGGKKGGLGDGGGGEEVKEEEGKEKEEMLLTGQESGDLVLWSITEESAEIRSISPIGIGALSAVAAFALKYTTTKAKIPTTVCLVLAGSLDGRIAGRLATNGGRELQDVGLIWKDLDRLSVRRIQLLDQTDRSTGGGGTEITCRFLLAKAGFAVVVGLRLLQAVKTGKWRVAEVNTESSLNTGLGMVSGMEISEDGKSLLVASQKGPILSWDMKSSSATAVELMLNRKDYWTYGFASSPCKSMYCLVENVSSLSDHLVLREPCRLSVFTSLSLDTIRAVGTELKYMSPCHMEIYRILSAKQSAAGDPLWPLPLSQPKQTVTRHAMQWAWWTAAVMAANFKEEGAARLTLQLEAQLRCQAALTVLQSAAGELFKARAKTAAAEFILRYSQSEEEKKVASKYKKKKAAVWSCRLCGGGVGVETVRFVACTNNHRWPRCSLSQLAVDQDLFGRCFWCRSCVTDGHQGSQCSLCSGLVMM